jgi:hypothetical protein
MNSRQFERRYMYLYIEPFNVNDLDGSINQVVNILNSLIAVWEPPTRPSFFRPDMWWEYTTCEYCKRRVEYEMAKWKAGEHVWKRGLCMRHWLVHHLSMIAPDEPSKLISNQPIYLSVDTRTIIFKIETMNYKYDITIDKECADMKVNYKGTQYRFTYRNHLNGHPFISSYMNILFDAHVTMELFRDFLTDYVLKRRLYNNLVINDSITIPPSPPTVAGCAADQS